MRIEYERVGYEVHVGEQPVDAKVLEGCSPIGYRYLTEMRKMGG
jgi:hypothetical protein